MRLLREGCTEIRICTVNVISWKFIEKNCGIGDIVIEVNRMHMK